MHASQDAIFLARCNQLALLGSRHVFPNPLVGAVIVVDGQIIGEGYHRAYGGPHAEVNAVAAVSDLSLLKQATLYVNLEPCNVHGKTPPCTDLILTSGIPRVVIGCTDPNPKVSGRGIKRLKDHGVAITLAADPTPFIQLNRRFFVNQLLNRPYITLKWAQSANGQMAALSEADTLQPAAITGFEANCLTHQLRATHQAILIGRNTAQVDDPMLTNRNYYGGHPIRLVIDRNQTLSPDLRLFQSPAFPTWVITERERETPATHPTTITYDPWPASLAEVFQKLYLENGICSILVEGGGKIHKQLLEASLFDELYVLQGAGTIHPGYPAPKVPKTLDWPRAQNLGKDLLWHFSETRFHPLLPDRALG